MLITRGKKEDIEDVLFLQKKYHIDTISLEDKEDGFVTTLFSKKNLEDLINENGLFIVRNEHNRLVAYAMAASWLYWSQWSMFRYMIKNLNNSYNSNYCLSIENSYQYGPICIDKSVRSTSVLPLLFQFVTNEMSKKYSVLVTFINIINKRSFYAHTKKLGLKVIDEFEFNDSKFYKLVY